MAKDNLKVKSAPLEKFSRFGPRLLLKLCKIKSFN